MRVLAAMVTVQSGKIAIASVEGGGVGRGGGTMIIQSGHGSVGRL